MQRIVAEVERILQRNKEIALALPTIPRAGEEKHTSRILQNYQLPS